MNYSDIFKKSFLEGYASSQLDVKTVLVCMLVTVLIASYIFLVYRMLNRNAFYNKSFHISLPALAVITAAIILTIQSSIVVSLGMVGALSIVRFRTAVKEPLDLVFLFWAISTGIICGAGFAMIAVIASIVATVVLLLANSLNLARAPQILLVNAGSFYSEKAVLEIVEKNCSLHRVKARNLTKDHLDMAIEVRVKTEGELVKELMELDDVLSASLVAHDGEVTF